MERPAPARYQRNIHGDCEEVCSKLNSNGTFDEIKKELVELVKRDEGLRQQMREFAAAQVAKGMDPSDKAMRRAQMDRLRCTLEGQLLEHSAEVVWAAMTDEASPLAQRITSRVHEALCCLMEEEARQQQRQQQQRQQQQQQSRQQRQQPPPQQQTR